MILLFCVFGFSTQFVAQSVYKDREYPLSIAYDSNWKPLATDQNPVRLHLDYETSNGFADISIVTNLAPKAIQHWSSEQFASETVKLQSTLEAKLRSVSPTGKLVKSGITSVHGKNAAFADGTATTRLSDYEVDIRLYSIVLLYQGNVYSITFRAHIDSYEEAFVHFKKLLKGIEIRPKPAQKSKAVSKGIRELDPKRAISSKYSKSPISKGP